MTYKDALIEALCNKDLVQQYDRLLNKKLATCLKNVSKQDINHQVDVATGYLADHIKEFNAFFFEFVWSRLPKEAFANTEEN